MIKVHCQESTCEYWQPNNGERGLCVADEVELNMDMMCSTYICHTEFSPEYHEVFWKRMSSRADKHECRRDAQGKRYEMIGLVWFTDQDDRWGTDEIWFTEQRSGMRIQGKDISGNAELIREKVGSVSPVDSLPEATLDDL